MLHTSNGIIYVNIQGLYDHWRPWQRQVLGEAEQVEFSSEANASFLHINDTCADLFLCRTVCSMKNFTNSTIVEISCDVIRGHCLQPVDWTHRCELCFIVLFQKVEKVFYRRMPSRLEIDHRALVANRQQQLLFAVVKVLFENAVRERTVLYCVPIQPIHLLIIIFSAT